MKQEKFFLLSERTMQLIRLMGSFAVFGAAIMLLFSTAQMFESWDNVQGYTSCIDHARAEYNASKKIASVEDPGISEIEILAQLRYSECREALFKSTGIYPARGENTLNMKQTLIAFFRPLAMIFFWAVIFFFGIILYNSRNLGFSVIEVPHEKHSKKESKKE